MWPICLVIPNAAIDQLQRHDQASTNFPPTNQNHRSFSAQLMKVENSRKIGRQIKNIH